MLPAATQQVAAHPCESVCTAMLSEILRQEKKLSSFLQPDGVLKGPAEVLRCESGPWLCNTGSGILPVPQEQQ